MANFVPDPDEKYAKMGMIDPQPIELEEGSYIYRFASSDRCRFGPHASPWWIRHEDFDTLMERAARMGVDLSQQARWDLNVLLRFKNMMNLVIQVRLTDTAHAWSGPPKPLYDVDNRKIADLDNCKVILRWGDPTIKQLYVCGAVTLMPDPEGEYEYGILTPRGRGLLNWCGTKIIRRSTF